MNLPEQFLHRNSDRLLGLAYGSGQNRFQRNAADIDSATTDDGEILPRRQTEFFRCRNNAVCQKIVSGIHRSRTVSAAENFITDSNTVFIFQPFGLEESDGFTGKSICCNGIHYPLLLSGSKLAVRRGGNDGNPAVPQIQQMGHGDHRSFPVIVHYHIEIYITGILLIQPADQHNGYIGRLGFFRKPAGVVSAKKQPDTILVMQQLFRQRGIRLVLVDAEPISRLAQLLFRPETIIHQ